MATMEDLLRKIKSTVKTYVDNKNSAEETRATTAEGILQDNIDAEESARQTAVTNEALARSTKDTDLQAQIGTTKKDTNNNYITLQSQIDKLTSVQNVVEVVGTYNNQSVQGTKLVDLTITDYEVGDKVQVVADERYAGATTVYEVNSGKTGWNYVGSFGGDSYTKAQSDANLAAHTDRVDNPHSVTKAHVGLGNVTNDKQIKAINSSTDNNLVTFDGTSGDEVKDSGKAISTNLIDNTSTDAQIPTAGAIARTIAQRDGNRALIDVDYANSFEGEAHVLVRSGTLNGQTHYTKIVSIDDLVHDAGLDDAEHTANRVSAFQVNPDNTHYPTEKLVKDYVDNSIETAFEITDNDYDDIEDAFQAALNPSAEE